MAKPGSAVKKVRKKKLAQPTHSTTYPEGVPTKTRPKAAKADIKAYWVAVNRLLQSAIRSATKATLPIPPHRFSIAIAKIMIE